MPAMDTWDWRHWSKVPHSLTGHYRLSLHCSLPQPKVVRFTNNPDRLLVDNVISQDQCDKLLELTKVHVHYYMYMYVQVHVYTCNVHIHICTSRIHVYTHTMVLCEDFILGGNMVDKEGTTLFYVQ